MMGAAG
jgi:hypothetical protein